MLEKQHFSPVICTTDVVGGMEITMIKITQLKLSIEHTEDDLKKAICKTLKIKEEKLRSYRLLKKSIDARKKNDIKYIYAIDISLTMDAKAELQLVKKIKNQNITISDTVFYSFEPSGSTIMKERPVVIGTGPAGLFSAYMLAKNGYRPIVVERGEAVDERIQTVENFWKENQLNPESNVQFGEGGAGTFSDGKLNTMVKDEYGRGKKVLEIFVEHGAPKEIEYLNKPHIGTDQLRQIVKSMREEIIEMGGEVRFLTKVTDFIIKENRVVAVELNQKEILPCEFVIVAIGHSARDTFEMIYKRGVELSQKSFAIGVRAEHEQLLISKAMYGDAYELLPTADYKVTHKASNGRGVYSFCMCPGGFVVNSSSEEGHLVVNGMSNYHRDEKNANSAIIVTVTPEDFTKDTELVSKYGADYPLLGMEFQRKWEKKAYEEGQSYVPVQRFGDLLRNEKSGKIGKIQPNLKGNYRLANLNHCLPKEVIETIIEGMQAFDRRIPGFADEDVILEGVETRTSSPIRMNRNEEYVANINGFYPCGEGAGYAGGITSAAMDGIKVYEAIAKKYRPFI